jgi:hypothetical protein
VTVQLPTLHAAFSRVMDRSVKAVRPTFSEDIGAARRFVNPQARMFSGRSVEHAKVVLSNRVPIRRYQWCETCNRCQRQIRSGALARLARCPVARAGGALCGFLRLLLGRGMW